MTKGVDRHLDGQDAAELQRFLLQAASPSVARGLGARADGTRPQFHNGSGVEDVAFLSDLPGGIEIGGDQTLTAAMRGAMLLVDTSTADVTLTVPALSGTGFGVGFPFDVLKTHENNKVHVVLSGGDQYTDGRTTQEMRAKGDRLGFISTATDRLKIILDLRQVQFRMRQAANIPLPQLVYTRLSYTLPQQGQQFLWAASAAAANLGDAWDTTNGWLDAPYDGIYLLHYASQCDMADGRPLHYWWGNDLSNFVAGGNQFQPGPGLIVMPQFGQFSLRAGDRISPWLGNFDFADHNTVANHLGSYLTGVRLPTLMHQ